MRNSYHFYNWRTRLHRLLPLDENGEENEEGEVFIYRYSEDSEGNPSLDNIEDDEEYEAVSDRFDELLDEAAFEEMDD